MEALKQRLTEPMFNNQFSEKLIEAELIFNEIYAACNYSFSTPTGSYLFNGHRYEYDISTYPKQQLLFHKAQNATRILEIGVYMGHSILIMLLANPKLKITCVDIDATFSKPATDVLKEYFPEAEINFLCGDSLAILPTIQSKFDLFHIDGCHDNDFITKEFEYCKGLTGGAIMNVIFDDEFACKMLQETIKNNYHVLSHIYPGGEWSNAFYRIELGK